LPNLYDYIFYSGYFKGKQQKDALKEAIEWWDKYLVNIESQ